MTRVRVRCLLTVSVRGLCRLRTRKQDWLSNIRLA